VFDGKKPFIIHARLRLPFASFIDNIELSPLAKKDKPAKKDKLAKRINPKGGGLSRWTAKLIVKVLMVY